MSKFKRLLSFVLTISLLCTTFLSTGMIAYASLLPLEEVNACLVLNGVEEQELKSVPLSDVLNNLVTSNNEKITIPSGATDVWMYVKDENNEEVLDSYNHYLINENPSLDLSTVAGITSYTLELIVGSGGQLNSDNVRYIIKVYVTNSISSKYTFELYKQSKDGVRSKVEPYEKTTAVGDLMITTMDVTTFTLTSYDSTADYYIEMAETAEEHPNVKIKVYNGTADNLLYKMLGWGGTVTDITDKVMHQDMTQMNAGYTGNFTDPNNSNGFLLIEYTILDWNTGVENTQYSLRAFGIDSSYSKGYMYSYEGGQKKDVVCYSAREAIVESMKINPDASVSDVSGIHGLYFMLHDGYSVDEEYYVALDLFADNYGADTPNHVEKAVVGSFASLEEAANEEDIQEQLLAKGSNIGYKANYNYENNGQFFTVFLDDGTVWKCSVRVMEYDPQYDPDYMRSFTDKPIIGEADPWLRVTGASSTSGREYDTYVIENGKNINMDTYYGYGYQTIFINDANADLSNIKPEFWYANTDRVYAVDENTGDKINSDHIRDFSNENQQYTGIIIDNNKENERNYWVTFKKLYNGGSKLFVYGPEEREVIFDEYFEFKHDILIANIGNAPLEDIKVELRGAEHVKLDPYWTVGGDGNDTLAAFTTTEKPTQYGELANMAKIRLLPDGDGTVKGTLVITAKGQEPVMIALNGTAQTPEIITETLDDAVKYVPYQHIIATNNMHDWVETKFSMVEGQLPAGITLNEDTGEIYGVPTVPTGSTEQTYSFMVKATFLVDGVEGYFESATKQFSIKVKPNTDENVYLASDSNEGYYIEEHIGTEDGQYHYVLEVFTDTVFKSNGEFAEFKALWLNGEKLVVDIDYDAKSGSTKITVKGQTFENKANTNETNTIAMEFRNDDNELNRTSQNFVPKTYPNVDKVVAKINALPSATNITLSNKSAVQSARIDYNALSSTEKNKVTNYSKLVACENKIAQLEADQSAANAVIAKINAIPSTINSNVRDEITAARTAYNALTYEQKNLVTNLKRLTDAEAALQQYDAQQADKAAAENVEALIRAISSTIDANAKDEIQAARASYNALTSAQKGYVSNYSRLTDAENALNAYEEQQAQIAADKAAANTVVAKINAIPANLTLDDKDDVNAARTAYNALTSAQKGYVTNYIKLTSAEERIIALEEEAAEQAVVNAVIAAINEIPDNITLNDKAKVSAARNAYNVLTNAQKEKVVNYSDLTDSEAAIAALEAQENANKADKEAADAVIVKINSLTDEITLNDKNVVEVARTAYDALTQKQKDLVTNYSILINAEASIKALEEYEAANKRDQEAAKAVIDLIDALPGTISLEDKNDVAAARTAYDALTDKQKEIVTNYSELTAAEVKIAELEDDNYEEVQKVTFVGIMVDKDGNAYADKLIEIHSVVQNGRTDENGSFQFNNVEFGEHTIYIKSEDGSVIAQKSFNIKIGSPLSITDDEIVAENGAIFTVRMQVEGNDIKFLSVEEGNKAPIVDTDKDDEGGIDIGDDKTPEDDDDDDDGINIGDADKDDGNKDDGSKPKPDQDVQQPQTGDNSNITLWVILLIVSLFGLCITSKKTFFEKKAR